jgi:hypothetical protein
MLAVAIGNGAARVALLNPMLGDAAGHVASTILLCALIGALTWAAIGWIGPSSAVGAGVIGALWTALTVGFEFSFGRFVTHTPWAALLADYDVTRGRIWILVLATTSIAPYLAARARHLI